MAHDPFDSRRRCEAGALMTAWPGTGIDVLMGVGGTPEAVLAACGLGAMRGTMQGILWPRNVEDRRLAKAAGIDLTRVLTLDDLVSSNDTFFVATGISDGTLLDGVNYSGDFVRTHSLVTRGLTHTVRDCFPPSSGYPSKSADCLLGVLMRVVRETGMNLSSW